LINRIDYTVSNIEKVSVHNVGNITNGDVLHLSKYLLDTSDSKIKELLFKFFLTPFTTPEFYSFTFSNDDFKLNTLFNFSSEIFDNPNSFHSNSINIAKLLYELSVHPQIKSGDLFVVYFSEICLEDELIDAIGIFKSENRQSFLKLESSQEEFLINYEDGINIDKLDKGCLIFNTDRDLGYRVCIIDKSNKTIEAQYWKDNFLQLKPCSDNYHNTKDFMIITKNFVTKKIADEFDVSKADQINMMNRTVEYFKTNEKFDKNEFENHVFQDEDIIKSFNQFDETYRESHSIEMNDNFEISPEAVKKQSKVLKSILKLDNNFHIYIHGNTDLIEKGVDNDGKKFYKIYYNDEK
jgi:hypothetical protein